MELAPQLAAFIERMPKVEVHLHLEGSFEPQTLLAMAARNHVNLPANDLAGLQRLLQFHDFREFLAVFMELARAFVRGEDFERLAYELGQSLADQHVRYAEIMLSPMQHLNRGVDLYEAIAGAAAGFERVKRERGLAYGLVLDYGRQYGPAAAWDVLEVAKRAMPLGVVGWSIGGNEIGYPPEPFAEVFAAAKAAGLGLMAHAGEVVGAASVRGAVEALGVQRIGHGIRSVEDPAVLALLRERGVMCDVCPSSNFMTGAAKDWASHSFPQLRAAGVKVSINSDDTTFFATTLTEELRRSAQHFGLGIDDLITMTLDAAEATFLPAAERATLVSRLQQEFAELRRQLGIAK